MYFEGKDCWLNHLDATFEKYNNRVHGTTKMTPFEMPTNNKLIPNITEGALRNNYTAKLDSHKHNKQTKFQVEDFVRVPDKHN